MTRHFTKRFSAAAVAGLTLAAVAATSPAAATRAELSAAPSNGRFYGVAALSATDAWAVGLHPGAFIAHWDGTSWTQSFTSNNGFFFGVGAGAPDDVWAAGGTNWFHAKTMIDHWNGTAWTRVPTPSPAPASYFRGVAATSATDAWAVGLTGSSPGSTATTRSKTLIEHWNGTAWTRVSSPSPRRISVLDGVAATSPTDAWAVGWTERNATPRHLRALILHWDGTSWTQVPVPSSPGTATYLSGVAPTSATDQEPSLRRPQDLHRALGRHELDPGAQPQPQARRKPRGRDGPVAHRRLGNRHVHSQGEHLPTMPDADRALGRHRLDDSPQPQPATRLPQRPAGRGRHRR
jgi:hypothetical protein